MLTPKQASKVLCGTILVGSLAFTSCNNQTFNTEINLIPEPSEMSISSGIFKIDSAGLVSGTESKQVRFRVDPDLSEIPAEGYRLKVDREGVQLTARTETGLFYGKQTLLQLLTPEGLPFVQITDAPRFAYRGLHLDVSRHFFPKEEVMKILNAMAYYKLNTLHMHLTDAAGWRIQIDKYPRLTTEASYRTQSDWREWWDKGTDRKYVKEGTPGAYGGYYNKEDIREILDYARVRGVEVIPEIEFPAHILSAVVAYPWLSCTGEQHQVPRQHFISRDLLCAGKESSYKFLADVLEETADLFPSKYINIGGDEAVYTRWEQCPDCQAVMKREGLTKASQLQGYMTNRVLEMMGKKDRTVIGWEEIIQRGKLNDPVVALIWHRVGDTIQATQTGHKAILTPATHMYLDFPESRTPGEVKAATWMPPISVEKCYSMDVNDYSAQSTVIGVQGCLWSDQFIHGEVLQEITPLNEDRSERYAEYLTFPRLLAVSEVAWTPKARRDYADFAQRLTTQYARLDNKDCSYRVPEPRITAMEQTEGGWRFTLEPSVAGADIRYTTDGSYPNIHSPRYTGPVAVADKNDFHAMTVVTSRHFSLPTYFAPDYSAYKQYGEFTAQWKPLEIQTKPATWRFECTGKISGNGTYELTFVQTRGSNPLVLGGLKLLKRDEQLATVATGGKTAPTTTYTFTVDSFEAGTPFFIEVEAYGEGGNDTAGLVFLKKK